MTLFIFTICFEGRCWISGRLWAATGLLFLSACGTDLNPEPLVRGEQAETGGTGGLVGSGGSGAQSGTGGNSGEEGDRQPMPYQGTRMPDEHCYLHKEGELRPLLPGTGWPAEPSSPEPGWGGAGPHPELTPQGGAAAEGTCSPNMRLGCNYGVFTRRDENAFREQICCYSLHWNGTLDCGQHQCSTINMECDDDYKTCCSGNDGLNICSNGMCQSLLVLPR